MNPQLSPPPEVSRSVVPASNYTYEQLAAIYNQARVDYIVPMPMNARRMAEYIQYYDIDLNASFVSLNSDQLETGVGMLGVRGQRSWITRLGVIPERRGHHLGQYLMENMLDASIQMGMERVQLEVIQGNIPAHQLFLKLGFETVRELLVIRRPPGTPDPEPALTTAVVTPIEEAQAADYLNQRTELCSWLDETASLLNAGSLRGVHLRLADGDEGWVIFQRTPFQLTHFAWSTGISPAVLRAALTRVHLDFPMQDTKIENLGADHPVWATFQQVGYFEVFRRIEMLLYL